MQAEMRTKSISAIALRCKFSCNFGAWQLPIPGSGTDLLYGKLTWRYVVERHSEATVVFSSEQSVLPEFATTGIQLHVQGSLPQ